MARSVEGDDRIAGTDERRDESAEAARMASPAVDEQHGGPSPNAHVASRPRPNGIAR